MDELHVWMKASSNSINESSNKAILNSHVHTLACFHSSLPLSNLLAVVLLRPAAPHVNTAVYGSSLHKSQMGLTCCTVIKQSLRGSEVSPFNAINSYCHLRGWVGPWVERDVVLQCCTLIYGRDFSPLSRPCSLHTDRDWALVWKTVPWTLWRTETHRLFYQLQCNSVVGTCSFCLRRRSLTNRVVRQTILRIHHKQLYH